MFTSRYRIALTLGLLTSGLAQAQTSTTFALPGEKVFPESIAFQPATGDFYVGSLLDGTVIHGNVARSATDVFLPAGSDGRQSAAGMKIDGRGRLFIAGGQTGKLFVYHTKTHQLLGSFQVKAAETVVNDIAILPNGDAYITDTSNPVLYRVRKQARKLVFEDWLPFAGTVVNYQPGYNINGIVGTADGNYLVVVQTGVGKLFRIDIRQKSVQEIPVSGGSLLHGDGLALDGHTLYVARNYENTLAVVTLSADYSSATITKNYTDTGLQFPTAVAKAKNSLLVVGAQLDKMQGQPVLPFQIIRWPLN